MANHLVSLSISWLWWYHGDVNLSRGGVEDSNNSVMVRKDTHREGGKVG